MQQQQDSLPALLARLRRVKGDGATSVVTLLLPGDAPIDRFGAFLRQERATARNIKSRV